MSSTPWNPSDAAAQLPAHTVLALPEGAHLVITPPLVRLCSYMQTALRLGGRIIVVSGAAGTGKTTLLAAACAVADIRTVNVDIKPKSTSRGVVACIAAALGLPTGGTSETIQDRIAIALRAEPTILVVDEAQNVGLPCLLTLRWLSGATNYQFGLVLAGADLDEHLAAEPQLARRVHRRIVLVRRKFNSEVHADLLAFHPVVASIPQPVLIWVDMVYADGLWSNWTLWVDALLETGYDPAADDPDNFARVAIAMITDCMPPRRLGAGRAAA